MTIISWNITLTDTNRAGGTNFSQVWSYGNRMGGDRHFFLFVISKFSGVEFHTWDFLRCGVLLNSTQSPPALDMKTYFWLFLSINLDEIKSWTLLFHGIKRKIRSYDPEMLGNSFFTGARTNSITSFPLEARPDKVQDFMSSKLMLKNNQKFIFVSGSVIFQGPSGPVRRTWNRYLCLLDNGDTIHSRTWKYFSYTLYSEFK